MVRRGAGNDVGTLDRLLEDLMEPVARQARRRAAEAIRNSDRVV
jgi:hypothetical protein